MATEEITLKELFERVVTLETKFDLAASENKKTRKQFRQYVLIMILLLITNILVHAVGMFL